MSIRLRRMVLTLAGELLSSPIYLIGWWISAKGLEIPGPNPPPPWSTKAVLVDNMHLLLLLVAIMIPATVVFALATNRHRRWRLYSVCWIWLTGLWAPFLLSLAAKPWLISRASSILDLLAVAFLALITTLVPLLLGSVLAAAWFLLSLLLERITLV